MVAKIGHKNQSQNFIIKIAVSFEVELVTKNSVFIASMPGNELVKKIGQKNGLID